MPITNDSANNLLKSRMELFADLERRLWLFAPRVDGWSPWRVMRNWVNRSSLQLTAPDTHRRAAARISEAIGATFTYLVVLVTAPHAEVLVKTCRSALRLSENGSKRDVYFDGLLSRIGSYFKLEAINVDSHRDAARRMLHPPHLNPIAFTFLGRMLGSLFPLRAARPFCETLAVELERSLGVRFGPAALLMRVSTVHWQARLYRLLLKRVRPSIVLVSDTGEYALRLACARLGIAFLELQHGVFDSDHPDAVPAEVQGSAAELLIPDILACRGQYWIDQLATTRQGRGPAIAVGHELIDQARAKRAGRAAGPLTIVFTSQGYDLDRAAAWLGEAVAGAPESLEWRLIVKLHPAYDQHTRSYDHVAANPRVTVVAGQADPNIYDLLADADLHLSISSACLFDAAAIGVRSLVVPLRTHELVLHAVDGAAIALARHPNDMWTVLGRGTLSEEECRYYSLHGFLDNMEAIVRGAIRSRGGARL